MRLHSITLRNYRVHREIAVELDPSLTLIGGPNESGKSTLVEGAHRALFLRAKTGGETYRSMVSIHGGQPEVELTFEASGHIYRLVKRFGAAGTVSLSGGKGQVLSGEEAETSLAALLKVEAVGGGRAAGDRAREQWAHLWTWQGSSGDDPTGPVNSQCSALLTRLQEEGGAAGMQSEGDAKVAGDLAARYETLFTRTGTPKAGTDLARAIAEEESALKALASAKRTLEQLDQAVRDVDESERILDETGRALEQLEKEQVALDAKRASVEALRSLEQVQTISAAGAAEKHEACKADELQIRALEVQIAESKSALAPKQSEIERQADEYRASKEADEQTEISVQKASTNVRAARHAMDFAMANVQRFECGEQVRKLAEKVKTIRALQSQLRLLQDQLAGIPPITSKQLESLQNLDRLARDAETGLRAMAAGVEVISTDAPVTIAGDTLVSGQSRILTEDTELAIGKHTRIRIQPGGGTTLTEARSCVQKTHAALQEMLDKLAVGSGAEAALAFKRRQEFSAQIQSLESRLEGMGSDKIEEELRDAEHALAAAVAETERRALPLNHPPQPGSTADAKVLARQATQFLTEAEMAETTARNAREASAAKLRQLEGKLEEERRNFETGQRLLTDLEAQLRLLTEKLGPDSDRAETLASAAATRLRAEEALAATRKELSGMQPALLENDIERCNRALTQQQRARTEAQMKRAVAQSVLLRDGTSDPHLDAALAASSLEFASARRAAAESHANAIRLLHGLFTAEQKALADQFTEPLAAKISGYLECIFGTGARATVSLEENAFTGLHLARPGQGPVAFPFNHLSGGTCEQVAAAVRLAMAEVLAPAHGGCLPLVFDDAFANSDPERIRSLQRMLDYAARRGLQIIILTCNSADYAGLGAKQIALSKVSQYLDS